MIQTSISGKGNSATPRPLFPSAAQRLRRTLQLPPGRGPGDTGTSVCIRNPSFNCGHPQQSSPCLFKQAYLFLSVCRLREAQHQSGVSRHAPASWSWAVRGHTARGALTTRFCHYLRHTLEGSLNALPSIPNVLPVRSQISVALVWPARIKHDQLH